MMVARRMMSWVALLGLIGLVACSTPAGEGEEVVAGKSCLTDEDCPGGSCDDGHCISIFRGDAGAGEVVGGTKDVGAADGPAASDPDLEGPEGEVEPAPDVVDPEPDIKQPQKGTPIIMVDPLDHTFTYLPGVNNPQTKAVTIYNQGDWSLDVTGLEWQSGSSPEFAFMALPPLPQKINPYGQTAVTVVFKEKAPHGPATLLIHSSDPANPTVQVQFYSQSKTGDEPCMQIKPTALNFGQVVRGTSKALTFEIVNCSAGIPLVITKIDRSKFFGMPLTAEFQIDPMPFLPLTIPGNSSSLQTVTYTPGLAGVDNGYFIFKSSDASLADGKLDVYGVGVPPPLEEIGLHIELEWDKNSCDVDLHLVKPGGKLFDCKDDCYYANMNPDWGTQGSYLDDPFLDYDDVDGYGPENTNLSEPISGVYKVVMHYFNDSYEGSGGGPTKATVRIFSYGQLLQTFGPQTLEKTDRTWDVCNVTWPGPTITPLGSVYEAPQQPVCLPW